jgi:glycolate oxidase FAD binding subunit
LSAAPRSIEARLSARGFSTTPFAPVGAGRAQLGRAAPERQVEPADVAALREIVIEAGVAGEALIPVGGASALAAGRPLSRQGLALSLARLDRITDHSAADFVVTVEAGCRFAKLQAELSKHRQWLAVEPPDRERATVGGMIAAAAASFVAGQHGTLRHHLLGVQVMGADGQQTKAGGRVVKNVAGYDLMKLHHGALGTFGVIVAATFRLRPLPAADLASFTATTEAAEIVAFGDSLAAPGVTPAAGWFVGHLRADAVEGDLIARFHGARAAVVEQATALEGARTAEAPWRRDVLDGAAPAPRPLQELAEIASTADDARAALLTLHFLPSRTAEVLAALLRFGTGRLALDLVRGTGFLRLATDGEDGSLTASLRLGLDALRAGLQAAGAAIHACAGPAPLRAVLPWDGLDLAAAKVATRLRDELDPARRFNPGRHGA